MIEIEQLYNLNRYANIQTFRFGDKTIVLYDDHRCILTVLFEARRIGATDDGTNLIFFDRHDDARSIMSAAYDRIQKFQEIGVSNVSCREFKEFVEFDIREFDDDWVRVAMELGLINDVVNVGNEENTNIDGLVNNIYTTLDGKTHKAYCIDHLSESCKPCGLLTDRNNSDPKYSEVQKIFGYNPDGIWSYNPCNYVLDFDLDCFTTMCHNRRYAWPERIFKDEYANESSSAYLMAILVRNANLITICREPDYCGGIGESNKILEYLDKYMFEGHLGTSLIQ